MSSERTKTVVAKDGKEMVLIPSGDFFMGSESRYQEEKPVHKVAVKSFYMDKYPVTNKEYKVYCDATGMEYPEDPRWLDMPNYFVNYPDYPVINVSWRQARAYGEWAGKRLPTEEEWEYAARGGLEGTIYPWGDEEPGENKANYADRNTEFDWREFCYSTGYKYTSPVGKYEPNGYGLFDMAGNVWEWTEDWFFEYDDAVKDTESFKDGWGGSKVCRGGCYHSSIFDLSVSRRRQVLGGQGLISVGFRCVMDICDQHQPTVAYEEETQLDEWTKKLDTVQAILKDDMELCLGVRLLTEERARYIKNLGFTSVEQYVTWETVENTGEDCWDFSMWNEQVEIMKKVGLKWVPFLIAGPAYALPDWYRESTHFEGLRCLEHNIETKIQSIWDKKFYYFIERFIKQFADQYKDAGVIEALLLGITGDFGEAIFPDWHGNWTTQIPGLYHSHAGYWCNDRFALADFREKMKEKFGGISELNLAWGTDYNAFAAVRFPEVRVDAIEGFRVDEHTRAGKFVKRNHLDERRWVDFVDWYRDSMTNYAGYWMEITRRCFPDHPIYLCTGGNAVPYHGSNFADQCKISARYNGGVRITNEASKYAENFFVTNWVSSAGNFYNAYFGFEPAGKVTEKGVVCRIYNATATGAKELHYYEGNLFDREEKADLFVENLKYLYRSKPTKDIGVFYPDVSIVLGDVTPIETMINFGLLRDYSDFQFVDDRTVEDGILDNIKYLILCTGEVFRKTTLESIIEWVRQGGLLIGYNIKDLRAFEDNSRYGERLFCMEGGEKEVGSGKTLYIPIQLTVDHSLDIMPLTRHVDVWVKDNMDFYQQNLCQPMTEFLTHNGYRVMDGMLDFVYVAQLEDSMLVLNTRENKVEKKMIDIDDSEVTVSIGPNSIARI